MTDQRRREAPSRHDGFKIETPVMILFPNVIPADFVPILQEHVHRPYQLRDSGQDKWRELPEIPSSMEINPSESQSDGGSLPETRLLENIVQGPWESKAAYIGAHYQLLRYDAIYPLQDSVREYKTSPWKSDTQTTSVYSHVFIVGYTFANMGAAARIEFSTEHAGKRIRWSQSKRLQQGTIVALSPVHDKFKTICKVAVVAARPLGGVEQDPPQIDIFWASPDEAEFDPNEEYVMIESKSGYFEASRHMLVAMQKLMTESFPMAEYLVDLNKAIDTPQFVEEQPKRNLKMLLPNGNNHDLVATETTNASELQNVDILSQWPAIDGSSLDNSQMAALRRILSKKLAIVQGPPGTGKTFVSITALRIMLKDWKLGDPPILVSAQTNHALDQLLTLIEPFEPNFIRLGGRSSEDNITVQSRTLYRLRNQVPSGASGGNGNKKNAQESLLKLADEIIGDIQDMNEQGVDEAQKFRDLDLITQEQFESLDDSEWVDTNAQVEGLIYAWLGPQQRLPPKHCPPNNNGFEEEEDDPEYEMLNEGELEARKSKDEDEDMEALRGKYIPYRRSFIGRHNKKCSMLKVKKILNTTPNLWDIDPDERGVVYQYMKGESTKEYLVGFRQRMAEYVRGVNNLKIARWQSDATFIRKTGVKLIGCTTTGLSKYRGLLACLKPRTLLIEEAAETLEGTIFAAMFESLEQLILVGDHQQLQAHCNISHLEKEPYNLCVSLFERLVNNGIEFTMLNKQRRMIKELRELLSPFYDGLRDHSSVLDRRNRPPIPGMGGRDSYFFHHSWPESRDDAQSRFNLEEANMVVAFFNYLVLNGVEALKITVLTFYHGQRKRLLGLLKRNPNLKMRGPFNVFTVDSYQGEENDIILLSLVRSNEDGYIGFLDNKNRAVVALSRARCGMYIFGNCVNLLRSKADSYDLWFPVMMKMKSQERFDIDSGFPIVCSTHSTETIILYPEDLEALSGGCGVKCDGALPCGHKCHFSCHSFLHEDVVCKEPCTRAMICAAGHTCNMRCCDACRCPCNEISHAIADGGLSLPLTTVTSDNLVIRRAAAASLSHDLGPVHDLRLGSLDNGRVFGASVWQEWDATTSDRQLESSRSSMDSGNSRLDIVEVHCPVTVSGQTRLTLPSDVTRTIHRGNTTPLPKLETMSISGTSTHPSQVSPSGSVIEPLRVPALHGPKLDLNKSTYAAAARQAAPLSAEFPVSQPYKVTYAAKSRDSVRQDGPSGPNNDQRSGKSSGKASNAKPNKPACAAPQTQGNGSLPTMSTLTIDPTRSYDDISQIRLYVTGIHASTTNIEFKRLFEPFGVVRAAEIMRIPGTGQPRGFGFITMSSTMEADAAITGLNRSLFKYQVLGVEKAKPHKQLQSVSRWATQSTAGSPTSIVSASKSASGISEQNESAMVSQAVSETLGSPILDHDHFRSESRKGSVSQEVADDDLIVVEVEGEDLISFD